MQLNITLVLIKDIELFILTLMFCQFLAKQPVVTAQSASVNIIFSNIVIYIVIYI